MFWTEFDNYTCLNIYAVAAVGSHAKPCLILEVTTFRDVRNLKTNGSYFKIKCFGFNQMFFSIKLLHDVYFLSTCTLINFFEYRVIYVWIFTFSSSNYIPSYRCSDPILLYLVPFGVLWLRRVDFSISLTWSSVTAKDSSFKSFVWSKTTETLFTIRF